MFIGELLLWSEIVGYWLQESYEAEECLLVGDECVVQKWHRKLNDVLD